MGPAGWERKPGAVLDITGGLDWRRVSGVVGVKAYWSGFKRDWEEGIWRPRDKRFDPEPLLQRSATE